MTKDALTEANKALISTIFGQVWNGDLAVLDPHPGYWQTRQVFPMLRASFHMIEEIAAQMIAEGDMVFSYGAIQLVNHGPMAGLSPTGKQVVMVSCVIDEVQDNLVVQHNGSATWPDVMRQIGVLPPRQARPELTMTPI